MEENRGGTNWCEAGSRRQCLKRQPDVIFSGAPIGPMPLAFSIRLSRRPHFLHLLPFSAASLQSWRRSQLWVMFIPSWVYRDPWATERLWMFQPMVPRQESSGLGHRHCATAENHGIARCHRYCQAVCWRHLDYGPSALDLSRPCGRTVPEHHDHRQHP